jgi:tRNA pseudouridine38-40 synthase
VRLAVGIEYVGTRFAGWQRQDGAATVQDAVETALSRVAAHPVAVTCAGRTDAGVHALGQVAHFDTGAARAARGWVLGANGELPPDVAIAWLAPVSDEFHARYTALARSYRYVIFNRASRAPLMHERACWRRAALDAERMHAAAQALCGDHDFSAFRAAECQSRSALRRIDRIAVTRQGAFVFIDVTANAFLHHMVRNIAGSLMLVGEGARSADWLAAVLAARERRASGPTAPAGGLYLVRVDYPAACALPAPAGADLWAMIGLK